MSRKKELAISLSQEDTQQVQLLLGQYHQIAETLHTSSNQAEAEAALQSFSSLSEAVQLTILKALSKENTTDAADLLTAINALSPSKDIRKEARRSLIRLEASKIYPQWTPPILHTPAVQVNIEIGRA